MPSGCVGSAVGVSGVACNSENTIDADCNRQSAAVGVSTDTDREQLSVAPPLRVNVDKSESPSKHVAPAETVVRR